MTRFTSFIASLLLIAVAAPLTARGEEFDLDTAAAIPVFHHGRPKPLQTFAREALDTIHDRSTKLKLSLEGYFEIQDKQQWERLKDKYEGDEWAYIVHEQLVKDPKYAGVLDLFPEGEPRTFSATEAVLSWLTEPEKWEHVPFIEAAHQDLREVLDVKAGTGHLKYVSPHEVYQSESLREYLANLRRRQEAAEASGVEFQPTELDELVQGLLEAYNGWRSLAFDPREPLTLSQVAGPGSRGRFVRQITSAIEVANEQNARGQSFAGRLESLATMLGRDPNTPLVPEIVATLTSLDELRSIGHKLFQQYSSPEMAEGAGVPLEEARDAVVRFRNASKQLARQLGEQKDRIFQESGGLSASQLESFRPMFRELASKADELHRISLDMHASLYDEGGSLLVTPALNPYALAKHRDTDNTSQPWLSLQAVLYADELLEDYPQRSVKEVRRTWSELESAFVRRGEAKNGEKLEQAQENFAAALRRLGEAVEPVRRELIEEALPPGEQDEALLAYTAYPPQQRIEMEVRYNETDPFKWSWVLTLLSLACFGVAFGVARKPMFWIGVALLAVCLLWTAYGFYLRVMVTGWAPVTNMYETVVFVPWIMLLLGLWFLLLPMMWTGLRNAWRATAIPHSWEAGELDESQRYLLSDNGWNRLNWLMQPFRLALMAGLFYYLSIVPLGHGGRPYFPLLPNLSDVAGAGGVANAVGVWVVGIATLLLTVWFVPRLLLAGVLSLFFVPVSWREGGAWSRQTREVYPRQVFGAAAAGGATFFFLLAWWAPVLDEGFQPLQPVLRSNFWLTIHVLTIVASYGAGMLAWGLGLIALGYLIFGKYRDPAVPKRLPEGMKPADHAEELRPANRRPPEQVGVLSNYAYRSIQVAVLLLAAGTILGGLWADVSWGRFWGWDPKEVWALISLLVYLAILHGRFAGWFNHFGMIFGTVFGATMIAMSWYGVNFVLPQIADGSVGLHSYGEGAGGQAYVFGFVALNWLILGVATVRYLSQTSVVKKPVEEDETPIPTQVAEREKAEAT